MKYNIGGIVDVDGEECREWVGLGVDKFIIFCKLCVVCRESTAYDLFVVYRQIP